MQVNEIPVQQAAGAKVTRPLPSLAEWGVAMRDYVPVWRKCAWYTDMLLVNLRLQ